VAMLDAVRQGNSAAAAAASRALLVCAGLNYTAWNLRYGAAWCYCCCCCCSFMCVRALRD
jgi:hypothetical protein